MDYPNFDIGVSFKNVEILHMTLRHHAVRKAVDISFIKNGKKHVTVEYADKDCNLRLVADSENFS